MRNQDLKSIQNWAQRLKLKPEDSNLGLRSRRNRRGVTPLQFALWFILSLGVIVASITAFQSARDNLRASALSIQLIRAQAIVEDGHSYSGIFANGSLLVFLANQGFSDRQLVRVSAGVYAFTSPYDTAITITGNGARDFTISIVGIPPKGCATALLAFQESGAGLDSASIGSTALTVPLTEGAVQTACDNTTNTVNLVF